MTKFHMFLAEVGRPHSVWMALDYSVYTQKAPLDDLEGGKSIPLLKDCLLIQKLSLQPLKTSTSHPTCV